MHYDIVVIGGGLGGCAAAIAACRAGKHVVLAEETDWIGGQITAQGVSALDEHEYIETFGGTATYYQLRDAIRAYYPGSPSNPGNGWVSRLCFEPRAGLAALEGMLQPLIESGQLDLWLRGQPVDATVAGHEVQSVLMRDSDGKLHTLTADYFLDATELGDLLPLTGTAYVTGAEADTGEDGVPPEPIPTETQSFSWCFALEFCPGERHVIEKPAGYEAFRNAQPYGLTIPDAEGNTVQFFFFDGRLPFWTYRRMRDGALLGGNDVALINWHGNDYFGRTIIEVSDAERALALDEARRLSLGFLYWLQTECPRDDGGTGYPELKLRPDIMGSDDGLAKQPYIRESRRIIPLKRVYAHDISADYQPLARAANQHDSVGVGWYAMDLHPCVGERKTHIFSATKPFQIPLGSLIPQQTRNLIAACKNIGSTHLTNGAYRLQPVEWNIGEAAGVLAAYCVDYLLRPRQVWEVETHLRRLQYRLVKQGVPLAWTAGEALQMLLVLGALNDDSDAAHRIEFDLDAMVPPGTLSLDDLPGETPDLSRSPTWRDLDQHYARIFDEAYRS